MEVYLQGGSRKDIHGTDPQFLIEKILRERIYECLYWKKELLGCTAEIMVDRGSDLRAVGGSYGNQKPTDFICCVLKLLQLQPELEIILYLINQPYEKYLTCLACFYLRLTQTPLVIYQTLEPLLEDRRKIRRRLTDGNYELSYIDVFVDELLNENSVCNTILPRMTKRYILEDQGLLEPRVSPLEDELEVDEVELVSDIDDTTEKTQELPVEIEEDTKPMEVDTEAVKSTTTTTTEGKKKKWSQKKVKSLFKKEKPKPTIVEEEGEEEESAPPGFKDVSLSFHESNILRANLGIAPLKPPPGHVYNPNKKK